MDEIDQDLGSLEEEYYGLDGDDCGCGHHHHEGCGCGCHHEDMEFEAICPSCGETIQLTDEMLDEETMVCPHCGETLEFDFDEDDFEDIESDGPQEDEDGEE